MKKSTIIELIIIIVLIVILGVLIKFTISSNSNKTSKENQPMGDIQGQMKNGSSTTNYIAQKEITEDTTLESGDFLSETADENVILVDGDIEVSLSNITVDKTGDSDGGDNTSFYGTNSGIIAKNGANLNLKNITVTTNGTGANGVFSYGRSSDN